MIDIIIVNYNSTNYLINCLKSLEKSIKDIPAVIYVQDNASADGIDRALAQYPQIILTRNKRNVGFAKAVNQALKRGSNEYVLLLNPDTYATSEFIAKSVFFMDRHPDIGIMGPKILDKDGALQNSARAFPTLLTAFFGRTSFLSKWFPQNPITSRNLLSLQSDGKTPMMVDWVSGACMVIRRKAIEKVGLLDERFFMYWEDADWCKRMWDSGWKVAYVPQASVCHFVGGSSNRNIYRSAIEFHKSVYRLFQKHEKHVRPSYSLAKPIVLSGIFVRLLFVLFSHSVRRFYYFIKSHAESDTESDTVIGTHKIRVLRVISRLNIGGPAIHVHLLTEGLDADRFESSLITGKISPKEGDMSYLFDSSIKKPYIIPELQREISLGTDARVIWRIYKILCCLKPDVVHTHTAKAGMSARVAVFFYNLYSRQKVRTVHTFHGHVFEGYFSKAESKIFLWIERFLSKTTDAIIAISPTQKKDLTDRYHIAPPHKIKMIKLGFDLEDFLNNTQKGKFRERFDIDAKTRLIGIIGRLVPIKNHFMLIDAAKLFIERNPDIKIKFVIIGDGELKDQLMTHVIRCGVEKYVQFCGWIKDVSAVYTDLDILALTSLNEGTPVSIIEAMASSVPVIATDVGGVPDLLGASNGISANGFEVCQRGILCKKNDLHGFALGLEYLINTSESNKLKLRTEARKFAEREYAKSNLINEIENLYRQLIDAKNPLPIQQGRKSPPSEEIHERE